MLLVRADGYVIPPPLGSSSSASANNRQWATPLLLMMSSVPSDIGQFKKKKKERERKEAFPDHRAVQCSAALRRKAVRAEQVTARDFVVNKRNMMVIIMMHVCSRLCKPPVCGISEHSPKQFRCS